VQIEDYYPIDPNQQNSFYDYVKNFYIRGFNLDPKKACLSMLIKLALLRISIIRKYFPDNRIDLTLRNREAGSHLERLQQDSIFRMITGVQIMKTDQGDGGYRIFPWRYGA